MIKFNFSRIYDFPPELNIEGFTEKLKVIKETKLLGVMLSDDLKWASNTDYMVKNGFKRMWKLRRMKILEVEPLILLDVYTKEIRSVLELAVHNTRNKQTFYEYKSNKTRSHNLKPHQFK